MIRRDVNFRSTDFRRFFKPSRALDAYGRHHHYVNVAMYMFFLSSMKVFIILDISIGKMRSHINYYVDVSCIMKMMESE